VQMCKCANVQMCKLKCGDDMQNEFNGLESLFEET